MSKLSTKRPQGKPSTTTGGNAITQNARRVTDERPTNKVESSWIVKGTRPRL